jgi:hypothetical protein
MIENETFSRGRGGRKARKRDLFVAGLINHGTVAQAAQLAKISSTTGWRYLRDPDVLARLRETVHGSLEQSKVLLQTGLAEAVESLRRLLSSKNEPVQVAAARALLELGLKVIEIDDIQIRLDRLEQIAKSKGFTDDQPKPEAARPNGHG